MRDSILRLGPEDEELSGIGILDDLDGRVFMMD